MAEIETVEFESVGAFHSLGLPNADDLQLRSELLQTIAEIITERGLKQREAGKLLDMDQPRVSALLKGQISKFSTDRLFRALRDLGRDVEVRISPSKGDKGELRVAA